MKKFSLENFYEMPEKLDNDNSATTYNPQTMVKKACTSSMYSTHNVVEMKTTDSFLAMMMLNKGSDLQQNQIKKYTQHNKHVHKVKLCSPPYH